MKNIIGQHLIIGLKGATLGKDEADFIVAQNIGGVILFARNIESPEQVRELCAELQALRQKMADQAPLFISVDNEGGRVARLKAPFTIWPPQAKIGVMDSTSVAFKFAVQMGEELRSVGINLNYSPCADVLTLATNPAIGDRSFGKSPEAVGRLASAVVRGFLKSDIIPCAKHFPGHGNTSVDSHFELPIENKTLEELREVELAPFKKTLRARLEMIMMAHIQFPAIDAKWPSSLSKIFMQDVLREELRFRGLIITDDLGMKALTARWTTGEIAVRALDAGVDLLLYCNEPDAPAQAIEAIETALTNKTLDRAKLMEGSRRIVDFKRARILNPNPLLIDRIKEIVGCKDHLALAQAIALGTLPEAALSTD